MIVMPANASGWLFHSLARETGRIGHLYSPRDQRGPWPWIPYSLDNGAFSCWNPVDNTFDAGKWAEKEQAWHELLFWSQAAPTQPRWAVVPDVPGNGPATLDSWAKYAPFVVEAGIPLAVAVQDGMTAEHVRALTPLPSVIFVGGTTEWKWETVQTWCKEFPRVHVGRVNNVEKLYMLESYGAESCDGTGWNRGDRKRTRGLEEWARARAVPSLAPLWPHASRAQKRDQLSFA